MRHTATRDPGVLRDQLTENMRFYADARFKQLTLWLACITLCAAGVGQLPADHELVANRLATRPVIAIVAVFFTAVMWVMEVRAALYWVAHREKGGQWPQRTVVWPWLNATNALLLLYSATFWSWLWLGLKWGLSWLLVGSAVIVGLMLLVFSIVNYWPLWCHKGEKPA